MHARRSIPHVAFIPNIGRRASGVERIPSASRRSTLNARHSGNPCSGMTMIELSIVMAIMSVLLALVLGLGKHVNAVVKIRRAQADLGEWHEALNRWYLQFGEYPYATIDTEGGGDPQEIDMSIPTLSLSNLLARCEVRFATATATTNISFRSFLSSDVSAVDPWGTPYIYDCDPGRKAYTLYSCGPDSRSKLNGKTIGQSSTLDPTLDDIYFER